MHCLLHPLTAVHGTDRRLRNVCVDGGYLGQTGPDMLNARLSQDDPKPNGLGVFHAVEQMSEPVGARRQLLGKPKMPVGCFLIALGLR
jgi:hypothetical protein